MVDFVQEYKIYFNWESVRDFFPSCIV